MRTMLILTIDELCDQPKNWDCGC